MDKLTIRRPDDFHVHVRQGVPAQTLVCFTAKTFGRATIMPNTSPPIRIVAEAQIYRDALLDATRDDYPWFEPMMTLYLTDETTPNDIRLAAECPWLIGAKLYPAGATTNSTQGVTRIEKGAPIWRTLQEMEGYGLPLLIHGEMAEGDVFDRERAFIEREMALIVGGCSDLKVVLEHITTRAAVEYVLALHGYGLPVAATITPHHLLIDRNDLLADGLEPHNYCKPIVKRADDREALVLAATTGFPCFFAGTDSAPHPQDSKESHCCAAGCFTAPHAVELYAEVFERAGKIDKLEAFLSEHGANFFGLPLNEGTITLERRPRKVEADVMAFVIPTTIPHDPKKSYRLLPFGDGMELQWLEVSDCPWLD